MANDVLHYFELGMNTHQEAVVYMHKDCTVCRAEGFSASARVLVSGNGHSAIATLNIVENSLLPPGSIGLSTSARAKLAAKPGDTLTVSHAPVVASLRFVRKKIHGHALAENELEAIMTDISAHRYRDVEIAAFLSICADNRLDLDEMIGLTRAMVVCGTKLLWPGSERIFDKHCIGGVPGNRTTPLVVAIASAAGLIIPKTSSRAITSPAGTADTMETLFNVDFDVATMQKIMQATGACLVWGGAASLSPADDLMVRVERELDLDGTGQLVASVLSKKIAAGSHHVLIDIPVGPTAKVRSATEADYLAGVFSQVATACQIQVRCLITDGSQPIGAGIGPVQEAHDLLAVLKCEAQAPHDLREKSLMLAANLIDMARGCGLEKAVTEARHLLNSGAAWTQFQRIATAQGGMKALPEAAFTSHHHAPHGGRLASIDNRKLSRLAKLAGAPVDKCAGLRLHTKAGDHVDAGQALFTLYSSSRGEHDYALTYYRDNMDVFTILQNT
ncbi:MAG: hypothetical protein RLZZ227_898 [Pseudomonadota bacterium]|jgi:thymidine phosphorylase